ncbi:MAG TPA: HAMP domain-containing sensor histidine kinase [Syntrophales bacterium]|nr:HAMP domain-containing sensor histidine kinase [Syntrophales bacterium]
MRSTILVRMVIGYLAIFIPVAAVSAYAISQLSLFRKVTDDILRVDNRMKDLQQKLVDSVLTQTRYEKKYLLTKDKELYSQYMLAAREVSKHIDEAISEADTAHKRETLKRIKAHHARYKATFNKEVKFVRKNQLYPRSTYRDKKNKAVDEILRELRNLKIYTEQDTYERIKQIGESGAKASKVAMIMSGGFILLGMIISIFITRGITRPLSLMRKKTRQVAGGDFECNLDLSSPPEIRDMAQDFNLMCSKLREMDKMKSDFFSLMAHELRMPLASIKEGIDLLSKGIGDEFEEKRKELLIILAEESNRMVDLVNSLLDLSKMEAGMMTLNFEVSDIKPLIHKVASGMEPLAMAKNVAVDVEVPLDLPYVRIDKERILQALRNLTGNAVKFSPVGGHVTITAQPMDGGLRVSVTDTGPGIPKEDLSGIFDKFKQANMTSYSKVKGTGLGLAIVKPRFSISMFWPF